MIADLKSWWACVDGDDGPNDPPEPIDPDRLNDPFSQLPNELTLTPEQQSWLEADLTVPHSMLTLMAYQRAAAIRGPSKKCHQERRQRLNQLEAEARALGFELPQSFVTLLRNDRYINRLRFGCHWIELPDFICPCPLDEKFIMVLFLCEAQGCNYTHLLLGPDGSHCVTRTMHWYGQHPSPPNADSSDEEKQIFHYADSFAEFVCRSSDEIRQDELAGAEWRTKLADEARDSGHLDEALQMYQLALSYNPTSKELRERIAQCEIAR